jgi:hypothetical protein
LIEILWGMGSQEESFSNSAENSLKEASFSFGFQSLFKIYH